MLEYYLARDYLRISDFPGPQRRFALSLISLKKKRDKVATAGNCEERYFSAKGAAFHIDWENVYIFSSAD